MVFLTGRPGIGKTTVLLKIIDKLRAEGFNVGGMISREVREQKIRIGFEIIDISTGKKGWLAYVGQSSGPRIGKYRVNLNDLENVGVGAILNAIKNAEIIIIDEIGPMELLSKLFQEAVLKAINCDKPVIGTIHFRAKHPLITKLKSTSNIRIIEVNERNRNKLHEEIANLVIKSLRR